MYAMYAFWRSGIVGGRCFLALWESKGFKEKNTLLRALWACTRVTKSLSSYSNVVPLSDICNLEKKHYPRMESALEGFW